MPNVLTPFIFLVDLITRTPEAVIWFEGPSFAEYFFECFAGVEKIYWYYRTASEKNWAVINGLIQMHHGVCSKRFLLTIFSLDLINYLFQLHFRIPAWLMEFYKNCRPIATYETRRNPEVPELPYTADGKGEPREIPEHERPIFHTDQLLEQEPSIITKADLIAFNNEFRTNYQAVRDRFVKSY